MDTKRAEELIDKFNKGTLSPEEDAILNSWYISLYKDGRVNITDEDLQGRKLAVLGKLDRRYHKRAGIKLWPRIVAVSMAWKVAAAVAVITLGVWLYQPVLNWFQDHPELVSGSPLANDILPGKNTATITFDNGEVIKLSDTKTGVVIDVSKLSYNDGTTITSSLRGGTTRQPHDEIASIPRNDETVRLLAVATPRGGQYQVVLPDGTRVWLNADSKLEFPSQFSGRERKVLLVSGEAYFEVSKNKAKPFIVESAGTNGRPGQRVEVLGTHFNINSYADEEATKTTLLEGSVRISSLLTSPSLRGGTTKQSQFLKPNQQAVLTANNTIQVKQANTEEAIAWKQGYFRFNNTKITDVMQQLARWYNIEVAYEGKTSKEGFYGTISRFKNINEVLRMLEQTKGVRFKVEGRRVLVIQ